MGTKWPVLQISAIADLFDGPHATPQKTDQGPVFLGISNLADGRLELGSAEHLSEEDFVVWTRRVTPQGGDIVFSYETRIGEAALIPQGLRCCLGRRVGLLRPKRGLVDSRFLLYSFLGPEFQQTLRSRTIRGSTVDRIPLVEMPAFPIRVPDLKTQKAIASILGALDDKIELNRRMNETLEAIAQTIFKSWFVDFDPVCAKAERSEPPGLAPYVVDLFPDSFEDSEVGPIPKGWRVTGLSEIARFVNGLALQKYPPRGERSLPVIKIAQLRRGDTEGADRADVDIGSDYIVDDGDVLFSWSGSLECVIWTSGRGALNQHLFKVTSEQLPKWFYYLWILHHLPSFRLIAADKATTMGHIQRYHLCEAKVVVPSAIVLQKVDRLMSPIVEACITRGLESRRLAAIRDALLPKLISGEIRIADA